MSEGSFACICVSLALLGLTKKTAKFTIVNKLIFDTLNSFKTKQLFTDSSFYITVIKNNFLQQTHTAQ